MALKPSACAIAALSSCFLLVAACATSPRPLAVASTPVAVAAGDAGATDDEDDGEDLAEGDAGTGELAIANEGPCPTNMVLVATGEQRFCVDRYEASLVEADADGTDKPYPHWLPVDGHAVRAVSVPNVYPQGFISEVQADDACAASGKRLCSHGEWKTACMGPGKTTFPYGNARQAGTCHDTGKSAVGAVFGAQRLADPVAPSIALANRPAPAKASGAGGGGGKASATSDRRLAHATTKRAAETGRPRPTRAGAASATARTERTDPKPTKKKRSEKTAARPSAKRAIAARPSARPASVEPSVWSQLNDPRLGQVEGALARTGSHDACVNGFGVLDMVGNLHEWVKTDPNAVHGTFAGGYYLDTSINGDGCNYRTTAHAHEYHDYSTGFRCCADAK